MCTKVTYRGWKMCSDMPPTIEMFEERMRAEQGWSSGRKLKIFQGSYNTSVSASADTHAKGGALDTEKLNDAGTLIARECGTTSWQRGSPEDSYFDDHNHWIWIGCGDLSSGAANQVDDYYDGKDGLADGYKDKSPRPDKIVTCQQALEDYNGGGIFGMTDIVKNDTSKDQKFSVDGEWHLLKINDNGDFTLFTGPGMFLAITNLSVSGLAPGKVLQAEYVRMLDYPGDKPSTIEARYGIKEIIGTEGSAFDQIVFGNTVPGNDGDGKNKIRLMVNAVDVACTVTAVQSRVFHD